MTKFCPGIFHVSAVKVKILSRHLSCIFHVSAVNSCFRYIFKGLQIPWFLFKQIFQEQLWWHKHQQLFVNRFLSASAKLAFIWIINTKVLICSGPCLGFDLSYFNFFFVNFVHLELFFFTLYLFKNVYARINNPNIHTNIIGISSIQNWYGHPQSVLKC